MEGMSWVGTSTGGRTVHVRLCVRVVSECVCVCVCVCVHVFPFYSAGSKRQSFIVSLVKVININM